MEWPNAQWYSQKRHLEAHLQQLVRQLEDAGELDAAKRLRPLAFNPESHYATGNEWLAEIAFVADDVLSRFPPAESRRAGIEQAKRLAQAALSVVR